MAMKIIRNQLGATVIAELLIAVVVLAMAGFGGYQIHNKNNQKIPTCGDKTCFEQKFSACSPAAFTDTSSQEGNIYMEIYGKNDLGCKMLLRYTTGDPSWVNKNLTCNFDNSKSYQDSIGTKIQSVLTGKDNSCEGPFLQVLKTLPAQQ